MESPRTSSKLLGSSSHSAPRLSPPSPLLRRPCAPMGLHRRLAPVNLLMSSPSPCRAHAFPSQECHPNLSREWLGARAPWALSPHLFYLFYPSCPFYLFLISYLFSSHPRLPNYHQPSTTIGFRCWRPTRCRSCPRCRFGLTRRRRAGRTSSQPLLPEASGGTRHTDGPKHSCRSRS